MDLADAANWTSILSITIPASATALIWVVVRPVKQDFNGLKKSLDDLRLVVETHDTRDSMRFGSQEKHVEDKMKSLRTELDDDRKEAFAQLREDLRNVVKRLDDLMLMQKVLLDEPHKLAAFKREA